MYQLISASIIAACDWVHHPGKSDTKNLADLLADRLSQQYAHVPEIRVGSKITILCEVVLD